MSSVKMVKSVEEYNAAIAGSGLVCVDFFATWCPPCRMIAPILGGWAQKYEGKCSFFKVDVDELEEVSMEAKIECMPTFLFFKDGAKIATVEGAHQGKILSTIEQNI